MVNFRWNSSIGLEFNEFKRKLFEIALFETPVSVNWERIENEISYFCNFVLNVNIILAMPLGTVAKGVLLNRLIADNVVTRIIIFEISFPNGSALQLCTQRATDSRRRRNLIFFLFVGQLSTT